MALSKYGRYILNYLIGVGTENFNLTFKPTNIENTGTVTNNITIENAISYLKVHQNAIFIGQDIVKDDNNDVVAFTGITGGFSRGQASAGLTHSSVSLESVPIAITLTNTTENPITYKYYGTAGHDTGNSSTAISSRAYLLAYYEFNAPITVSPGETKTVQIQINFNNM